MQDKPSIKSGFLTSELYFGLIVLLVNYLINEGVWPVEQKDVLVEIIGNAILGVVSLGVYATYALGRSELKKSVLEWLQKNFDNTQKQSLG